MGQNTIQPIPGRGNSKIIIITTIIAILKIELV